MTDKQALKEARVLWGSSGAISKSKCISREEYLRLNPGSKMIGYWEKFFGKMRYTVGALLFGIAFEIKGDGLSWEEAFEEAKRRKA